MRTIDADALIMRLRLEYPMMPFFKELREEWEIKTEGYRIAEEIIKNAPTVESCEDAISRESVMAAINKRVEKLQADRDKDATSRAIDLGGIIPLINDIPSVVLNRPQGEWIQLPSVYRPKEFACGFMCSLCKSPTYDRFRYCPNCGAEMSKESKQ